MCSHGSDRLWCRDAEAASTAAGAIHKLIKLTRRGLSKKQKGMGNGAAKAKSSGAEKKLDSAEIERHDGKSETRRRLFFFFFDAAGRRLLGRHRLGLCSIPSALHRGVSVSPSMAQR